MRCLYLEKSPYRRTRLNRGVVGQLGGLIGPQHLAVYERPIGGLLIDNLISALTTEDQGMFSRHFGVLSDLHITVARHGLTADFTPSEEIAPFANGEELSLGAPGVGDQHTHNPAGVAFAQPTARFGHCSRRHRFRFSPLSRERYLPHHRPLTFGARCCVFHVDLLILIDAYQMLTRVSSLEKAYTAILPRLRQTSRLHCFTVHARPILTILLIMTLHQANSRDLVKRSL